MHNYTMIDLLFVFTCAFMGGMGCGAAGCALLLKFGLLELRK